MIVSFFVKVTLVVSAVICIFGERGAPPKGSNLPKGFFRKFPSAPVFGALIRAVTAAAVTVAGGAQGRFRTGRCPFCFAAFSAAMLVLAVD